MLRKLIAGILIVISATLLGLGIAGMVTIWTYNQPLSQTALSKLQAIDSQLGQAQTALQNARLELERTLRIVEAAEISVSKLKDEFTQVKKLFGEVNGSLDSSLIPALKTARGNLNQAKSTLQELLVALKQINALPFGNFNLPGDQILEELIASADSLDSQIVSVEELVKKASTLTSDASYLMGFDFSETRNNLQDFLAVIKEYEQKLGVWRAQLSAVIQSLPGWIASASQGLTIFLLWFGFSQLGLIAHGLTIWHGNHKLIAPDAIT